MSNNDGSKEGGGALPPSATQELMLPSGQPGQQVPVNLQMQCFAMMMQQQQQQQQHQTHLQQRVNAGGVAPNPVAPAVAPPVAAAPAAQPSPFVPRGNPLSPTGDNVVAILHDNDNGEESIPTPKAGSNKVKKKKKKTVKAKAKAGGAGTHFTDEEIWKMLDILLQKLPMGNNGWKKVGYMFNAKVEEERRRDYTSLRRKFAKLHSVKMPTGDPHMPDDVKRAKHIQYKIEEKSDLVEGGIMKDSDEDGPVESDASASTIEIDDDATATDATDATATDGTVDAGEEGSIASVNRKIPPNNSTRGKVDRRLRKLEQQQAKGKNLHVATNPMLQAHLTMEKVESKRRREQEKRRRASERRREKRRDKKDRKNMHLLVGLAGIAVSAFAGKKHKKKAQKYMETIAASSSDSDSEQSSSSSSGSDSLSSVSERDSPPTKRRKLAKAARKEAPAEEQNS